MKAEAGFINLSGNLFDSAIMKTSVISPSFSERFLSNPDDPNAFEGTAYVFDGPVDFHERIDDEALGMDGTAILVMRGAGPIGYPGGAEVVNMRPPAYLIKQGIDELPCIGDGRQSGTRFLDPQRLAGRGRQRSGADKNGRPVHCRSEQCSPHDGSRGRTGVRRITGDGGFGCRRASHQELIFRERVRPFAEGMVLDGATDFKSIVLNPRLPRDNRRRKHQGLRDLQAELLRYGDIGREKPGILDADGTIRDLSAHVDDITGATLDAAGLDGIRRLTRPACRRCRRMCGSAPMSAGSASSWYRPQLPTTLPKPAPTSPNIRSCS